MVVTFSQNIAPHSAISPVGLEAMSSLQGQYRNQAVQQLSRHGHQLHPQSFSALVGSQMRTLRYGTNLKDLVDRMRRRPTLISSRQAAFDVFIAETPPHEQQLVQELLQFLSAFEDLQNGGQGNGDYEDAILAALAASNSEEQKRRVLSLARGYFDGREDVDLTFLNQLDMLSDRYEQIAGTIKPTIDPSESATLETDPAAVRLRFRRQLREVADLGALFSDLTTLGIETQLLQEIGHDLSGLTGTDDRAYVRSLTRELSRLWHLMSSHEEVKEFAVIMKSHLGRQTGPLNVAELTTDILSFCSTPTVNQNNTRKLMTCVRHAPPQGQVVFANCLMDLHARLPDGVWLSTKDRTIQYSALRVLCGRMAEIEEQAAADAAHAGRDRGQR